MSAEILRIHPDEPEPERVEYVVSCLRSGKVVGIPTDTFYGLAVDPVNLRAVERIYEIKTRVKHKPLSLLIGNLTQAYELGRDLGVIPPSLFAMLVIMALVTTIATSPIVRRLVPPTDAAATT